MNTISAIRPLVAPDLRTLSVPGMPGTPAPVPARELGEVVPTFNPQPTQSTTPTTGTFDALFNRLIGEVDVKQQAASSAVHGLLSGQPVPLHQAMIAIEEASVSFQLMVEVRNRLLDSYQELMRMQI
jgi:flagellar hook-basal body complex protein FliE